LNIRHTISQNITLDGNFKANLFFKRDDGSDTALTDGKMYFPDQAEFEEIAKSYVIPAEDKVNSFAPYPQLIAKEYNRKFPVKRTLGLSVTKDR
jgi:hypothetical protein